MVTDGIDMKTLAKLSTKPSIKAPKKHPGILPNPPRIIIMKDFNIKGAPIEYPT